MIDKAVGIDEGAGVSNSRGVGSIAAGTLTRDADRTCSCTCEVCMSVSKVTFDPKVERVLCAAACGDRNELDSVVSRSNRRLITAVGKLGC